VFLGSKMKLKENVSLKGLKPEIIIAVLVANDVYWYYGHEMVITSVADSKHSRASLHYVGYAVDLRTRNIDEDIVSQIVEQIRGSLTDEFDVIFETNHIHIEYQPKNKM